MHSQQGKSRQPSKANKQKASRTIGLLLLHKTAGEPTTTAILTGIDVETGMVLATMAGDKQQDFQYHVNCIQSFLMESGRIESSTQQHHLTIRSGGSSDSIPESSSKQDGRQHLRQAVTSIQLTSTRQRRTLPSNTDGTN